MTKKQKIILGSSAIVLIMLILGLVFLWNPATTNNKDNITTVLGAPGKNCTPLNEKPVTNLTVREQTFTNSVDSNKTNYTDTFQIVLKPLPKYPNKYKFISGAMYQISGTFSYKIISGDPNTVIVIKPQWWNKILKDNVTPADIIDGTIDATAASNSDYSYSTTEKVKAVDASKTIDTIPLSQTANKITFKFMLVFDWAKSAESSDGSYGLLWLDFGIPTDGVRCSVTVSDLTITGLN